MSKATHTLNHGGRTGYTPTSDKKLKKQVMKEIKEKFPVEQVINPFNKNNRIQEFNEKVLYLREQVLPTLSDNEAAMGYPSELSFPDLRGIFHEKRTDGLETTDSENSLSNRFVMLDEKGPKNGKLVRKMSYGCRILSEQSSFNWLPMGILADTSPLQCEDRGHEGTLLFCKWEQKFKKETWKKVLTKNESLDVISSKLKKINDSIRKLLSKKGIKSFSFKDMIPKDMKKSVDELIVPIELKVYGSRDLHENEILGINEQEDTWEVHQKAMKPVERILRKTFNVRNDKVLDRYGLVKDLDLFLGNNENMFSRHRGVCAKMEMPEEEILWKYVSSKAYRSGDLNTYRGFDCTDVGARRSGYESAIINHPKLKDWKDNTNIMKWVGSCGVTIGLLNKSIKSTVDKLKKDDISTTNINDLSPRKVDAGLMYCYIIEKFVKDIQNNPTENMIKKATHKVFQLAKERISDYSQMKKLGTASSGAIARYEQFFSPLISDLDELTIDDIMDERQLLMNDAAQFFDEGTIPIPTDNDFYVLIRDENAKDNFNKELVNISKGTNLDKGHQKAGDHSGGYFLQFRGDNKLWGNKRDFIPSDYAKEYLRDVKIWLNSVDVDWMDDEDLLEAWVNTKNYVKLWEKK